MSHWDTCKASVKVSQEVMMSVIERLIKKIPGSAKARVLVGNEAQPTHTAINAWKEYGIQGTEPVEGCQIVVKISELPGFRADIAGKQNGDGTWDLIYDGSEINRHYSGTTFGNMATVDILDYVTQTALQNGGHIVEQVTDKGDERMIPALMDADFAKQYANLY